MVFPFNKRNDEQETILMVIFFSTFDVIGVFVLLYTFIPVLACMPLVV